MAKKQKVLTQKIETFESVEFLTDSLIEQLDAKELGIFISLLSHKYMINYDITKEQFMSSLNNSIDILEKKD